MDKETEEKLIGILSDINDNLFYIAKHLAEIKSRNTAACLKSIDDSLQEIKSELNGIKYACD